LHSFEKLHRIRNVDWVFIKIGMKVKLYYCWLDRGPFALDRGLFCNIKYSKYTPNFIVEIVKSFSVCK